MNDPRHESNIPPAILEGLQNYIENGVPTGSFLEAVLSNNLMDAIGRADINSMRGLPAIVCYVYQKAPHICHGSPYVYRAWIAYHLNRREGADEEKLAKLAEQLEDAKNDAMRWRDGR